VTGNVDRGKAYTEYHYKVSYPSRRFEIKMYLALFKLKKTGICGHCRAKELVMG